MMAEKKWLILTAAGLFVLIGFIVFTPKKEEFPRLWRKSINAIEYDGPTGPVRLEKQSGWFEDRFFITFSKDGKVIQRPGSPAVKGLFAEFEAPIVKGEYILDEAEANRRFSDQKCVRLLQGGSTDTLCSGTAKNGLSPVRMPDEPLRIYLLPDHLFSRLSTDPEQYVEKRLLVLPAGTVPDRILIQGSDHRFEFFRTKQPAQMPDGSRTEQVHWNLKIDEGEAKELQQPAVQNLLSALYDLQRDRLMIDPPVTRAVLYTIQLDLVVEGPAVGGPFQRLAGKRTLKLTIDQNEIQEPVGVFISAESEGVIDGVRKERLDRFTGNLNAILTP
jgi:hypothetical protein